MVRHEQGPKVEASDLPSPPLPMPGERWALFVDIDGTLVDFAATPDGVRIDPDTLATLARLSARLSGALAVLSGRNLFEVDRLLSPHVFPAGALHGLERRDEHGYVAEALPPPEVARRVGEASADAARSLDGVLFEDKAGLSFAIHYRLAPSHASAVRRLADEIARDSAGHYTVQPGDCVAELRPAGHDKGTALAALLETPVFQSRRPVMFGDDLTDEAAFAEARRRDGFGVIVGPRRPTSARYALSSPATTTRWLATLEQHLRSMEAGA